MRLESTGMRKERLVRQMIAGWKPLVPDWEEGRRSAAVYRFMNADGPIEGIYYLIPTPKGWEVMAWYLEKNPGESPEVLANRFKHLQHPAVWGEVLHYLASIWKFTVGELFESFSQYYASLPRGRVYNGNIGRGEHEASYVPNADHLVRLKFNLTERARVHVETHWDPYPEFYKQFMEVLTSGSHPSQGNGPRDKFLFSARVPKLSDRVQKLVEEWKRKGVEPGVYSGEMVNDLKVNYGYDLYQKIFIDPKSLEISHHPNYSLSADEWLEHNPDGKPKDFPIVVFNSDKGTWEAKTEQGYIAYALAKKASSIRVWSWIGEFHPLHAKEKVASREATPVLSFY